MLQTPNAAPPPAEAATARPPYEHELPTCTQCGASSWTLRAVAFTYCISVLIVSFRMPIAGSFCDACRSKNARNVSLITALLGWWGIPFGPIFSIGSLFRAITGGKVLENADAQLQIANYHAFLDRNRFDQAYSCLMSTSVAATPVVTDIRSSLALLAGAKQLSRPSILAGQALALAFVTSIVVTLIVGLVLVMALQA